MVKPIEKEARKFLVLGTVFLDALLVWSIFSPVSVSGAVPKFPPTPTDKPIMEQLDELHATVRYMATVELPTIFAGQRTAAALETLRETDIDQWSEIIRPTLHEFLATHQWPTYTKRAETRAARRTQTAAVPTETPTVSPSLTPAP